MSKRPNLRGVAPGEPGKLDVPKRHCRFCAKAVPAGRRNWCGQECIDAYLLRNDPKVARARTFERDRGVCFDCGHDTERLRQKLLRWLNPEEGFTQRVMGRRRFAVRAGLLGALYDYSPAHLWEMDHIRPVVEGGGGCGLDNLRTLCRPCHKRASRELAARRAAARREAKRGAA